MASCFVEEETSEHDLTPICLLGRNPRMPTIYKVADHPLHPKSNPGNTYLFYTRPTEGRMQELLQAGESVVIDSQVDADLESAGLIKLLPRDYLFTRNELGSRDPEDDVAVAWVVGPERQSKELMTNLDRARDKFMGPEEDMTEDSVRFERLEPKPKPVKEHTRCWTLGTSLEPNTNVEAPCANRKAKGGATEYHDIAHVVVVASTALAMEDMGQAPEGIKDILESEFNRHGMAPLGCEGNFAYHAVQCNLAYAGTSMSDQMGCYAGIHRDERDCPGHYTTMIARSKLLENYVPPRMILPGIGVYFELEDFVGCTFQALREHVGSPPYPRPGTQPSPTAYRFALVHYTPERMSSANTRQRIAALPTTQAFLSPEMRSSKSDKDVVKGLQEDSFANFLRDGRWIMEDNGFIPYVGRVCYQVNHYLLKQTDPSFKFELDPDLLARSITYEAPDGNRQSVPTWEMAPTVQEKEDTQREADRAASERRFKEHLFKHGSVIPYTFLHNQWIKEEAARRYGDIVLTEKSGREKKTATVGDNGRRKEDNSHGNGRPDTDAGQTMQDESESAEGGKEGCSKPKPKRKRTETEGDDEDGREEEVVDTRKARRSRWKKARLQADKSRQNDNINQNQEGPPMDEVRSEDTTKAAIGGLEYRRKTAKKEVTKREEEPFKLLQLLSIATLEDEILQLRMELLAEESEEEDESSYEDIKDAIDEANEGIETGRVDKEALAGVEAILDNAHRLSKHMMLQSRRLRAARQTLIKAQMALRSWIEGPIADEAHKAAKKKQHGGGGARQSWVSKLTNDILDMLVSKQDRRKFRASDYGLKWARQDLTIRNGSQGKNMVRGREDTIRQAVAATIAVVEDWVEADAICDKKQAWFASIVEDVLGEEAFTMNIVWTLYNDVRPPHIIQGSKGYRNPVKKDTERFRTALEHHSILDMEHQEGQLFDLYKKLLNKETSPSAIIKTLPSVSPTWLALQEMIQTAAAFDDDEEPHPTSPYFRKLQSAPMIYHPLRERTQGRRQCTQDLTGNPGQITKAAIFSLLAWRAFPQVFSWQPDYNMLFSLPEEFLDAHRSILKTEPSDSAIQLVNKFWSLLDEGRWSQFSRTYPTFDQCYQHFRPHGYLETQLYSGLSRTNAFDVACDLAYAGFCQPPSTGDVARYIVSMNSGALAGLRALGLADKKKLDVEVKRQQVHQALLDLGNLLREDPTYWGYEVETIENCTVELYREGEMDPMGLEYLLRAFSHASKYTDQ